MEAKVAVPTEKVLVTSFTGLYDEESTNRLYNINDRKMCVWWGEHTWVNGCLYWDSPKDNAGSYYSIRLPDTEGLPYAEIRLCERCKVIDCIHRWETEVYYKWQYSKYYAESRHVGFCKICKKRIYLGGGGECSPSPEAQKLVAEVIAEFYNAKPVVSTPSNNGWGAIMSGNTSGNTSPAMYGSNGYPSHMNLPSGYHIELPIQVSILLEQPGGEERAREYIKRSLRSGVDMGYMSELSGLHKGEHV